MQRRKRKDVRAQAEKNAEERVLDALVGADASPATRESFRKRLRAGELNDKEIEIQVADARRRACRCSTFPACPGASIGAINIGDMLGKAFGGAHQAAPRHRRRTATTC